MDQWDIIFLVPLLIGAYQGFNKGLTREIFGLMALILAVIGGFQLLDWGIQILKNQFGELNETLPYLAFILIFIGILVAVNILGGLLKKMLDLTLLGSMDNLAGALLGIAKWAFVISIFLWLSLSANIELPPNMLKDSILYPYLKVFAPFLIDKLSLIVPFSQDLLHSIQETLQSKLP